MRAEKYIVTQLEDGQAHPWAIVDPPEAGDTNGRLVARFAESNEALAALAKMTSRRAAVIVVTDGERALVSRRTETAKIYANALQYAGGKADPGEPLRWCAQRELREETGIEVDYKDLGYVGCIGVPPGGRYEGHGFLLLVEPRSLERAKQMEPENAGPWAPVGLWQLLSYSPGQVIPGFLTLTAMVNEYIGRYRTTVTPIKL